MKHTKIAVIGGGTGLSTMLRGLKIHTDKISAIVTVADDGGSSGKLRSELGMLPPGDVRNCVSALAEDNKTVNELLTYRFNDGVFKGHTWGNITLAALNGVSNDFEEAVRKFNSMIGITGVVYPVTNENVTLNAVLNDGTVIEGESQIGVYRPGEEKGIKKIYLTPNAPTPVDGVIKALLEADIIVLGPGSLYTSIIPNLLVSGVVDAIHKSKAIKVYVCNIMTQPGETDGYTVADHLRAIEKYSYKGIADVVIANKAPLPETLTQVYADENAYTVKIDSEKITDRTAVFEDNLILVKDEKVRHNFIKLARMIMYLENIKNRR